MNKLVTWSIALLFCFLGSSCNNLDIPVITTAETAKITETTAILYGQVGVRKDYSGISYGIIYSTSEDPSISNGTKLQTQEMDQSNKFFVSAKGLTPGAIYYYKAFLYEGGNYTVGEVRSFTTKSLNVNISTLAASEILTSSATINGNLVANSQDDLIKTVWFLYGASGSDLDALKSRGTKLATPLQSDGSFSKALTNLNRNTSFAYVACAKVLNQEFYGDVKEFTTADITATLSTNDATEITTSTAMLNGQLSENNQEEFSKSVWFLYGAGGSSLDALKSGGNRANASLQNDGSFKFALSSLTYNTTYAFVACSKIGSKEFYGEVKEFTTADIRATVETINASEVTTTSALLGGSVTINTQDNLSKSVWFLYGSAGSNLESLKAGGTRANATLQNDGTFNASIFSLNRKTTYAFVACLKVGDKEFYGDVKEFTTPDIEATVSALSATQITISGATLNGRLSVTTQEELSRSVWFLFSKQDDNVESLIANGTKVSASLQSDGSYSKTIASLSRNTVYYYIACAKIGDKYFYSNVVQFTTTDIDAVVTTNAASAITTYSITFNGSLTVNTQGSFSKSVWFRYGTTSKKEELLSSGTIISSTLQNNGSFSSNITNLGSNTTLYYIACAMIDDKEIYGEVKSATTLPMPQGAVDLGLSVLWASCNIGASAPEEIGGFYAWGEIATKDHYDWEHYKWCKGTKTTLTKYNTDKANGTVDNKTKLDPSDDVAKVLLGGKWRIPKPSEFQELVNNCYYSFTTLNGVNGYLFISKINGNSIFMPVVYREQNGYEQGCYWSNENTTPTYSARILTLEASSVRPTTWAQRMWNYMVRPVCDK